MDIRSGKTPRSADGGGKAARRFETPGSRERVALVQPEYPCQRRAGIAFHPQKDMTDAEQFEIIRQRSRALEILNFMEKDFPGVDFRKIYHRTDY